MRLGRVSHLVVSSVLASCGGESHPVVASSTVTIAPPPASTTKQADPPPADVMDVVPTDPNARMRFVSLGEIVAALVPPDPNRVALYIVGPGLHPQRISGPPIDDACAAGGPLGKLCTNPGTSGWVSVAKDGALTRGVFADLEPSRPHDTTIARAHAELVKSTTKMNGVWFIEGEPAEFPQARMLTESTKVAPSEEAGSDAVTANLARVKALSGDARERAILGIGLSSRDRALMRAFLSGNERLDHGRIMPLARGYLVEMITASFGGCGASSGYVRVVVLGSNVIVDLDRPGHPMPCKGRRPPGWDARASEASSSQSRFFEDAASAEAASVDAFELVARELEAFGAPAELVHRARSAARDEVRHAALMSKRAGTSPPCTSRSIEPRTPFEAALDNAVEGCVNESFAAIVARFQSRMARDADLAGEFAAIADDECAHGDLAWDIAAWLEPRLSPAERARVSTAREHAKRRLVAQAFEASGATDDDSTRKTVGLPSRHQATALAKAFVDFT